MLHRGNSNFHSLFELSNKSHTQSNASALYKYLEREGLNLTFVFTYYHKVFLYKLLVFFIESNINKYICKKK